MKKTFLVLAIAGCMACGCNSPKQKEMVKSEMPSKADLVKRGELLVAAVGCSDCHSPKKMTPEGPVADMDRFLSGHPASNILAPYDKETAKSYVLFSADFTAAIGPWGTSFSANLTPDPTGIGSWTEEQFFNAIKKGKWKGMEGNRPLLPPMPWEQYKNFPDEDISAIFAYLKTLKPVNNVVPLAIPPNVALITSN